MTGRRRLLLPCLGGFVVASVACAAAPALGVLVISRLVQGTAMATEETLPPGQLKSHAVGGTFANIKVLPHHRPYLSFVLSGAFGFGAMFAYVSASAFVYQDVFGMSAQLYS